MDEKQLALLNAQISLIASGTPPEEIFPLADLYNDLQGRNGKRLRRMGLRTTLAVFSAAVTILRKGRAVDAIIAEIATPNGLSRKEIKNFRDRLNRGLASPSAVGVYREALAYMGRMTETEIRDHLANVARSFVPKPA